MPANSSHVDIAQSRSPPRILKTHMPARYLKRNLDKGEDGPKVWMARARCYHWDVYIINKVIMMTSSNRNICRVTGHLCGEFTGHRWIPRTKASDAEFWCFLWSAADACWVNIGEAVDLRRHRAHYNVTVMVVSLTARETLKAADLTGFSCRTFVISTCLWWVHSQTLIPWISILGCFLSGTHFTNMV